MFNGMEMMVSKMIGLTPDQLQAMANDLQNNLKAAVNALANIEAGVTAANAKLDALAQRMDNDGHNHSADASADNGSGSAALALPAN